MDTDNKISIEMSEEERIKLDRQLCFALYVSSKEVIRSYKPFLEQLNLTYTGYIAMLALWETDNQSVKSLGDRLTLDSGTLTPLLKKLEAISYITRTRSVDDERSVMISLTPKGKKLKEAAAEIPEKVFTATEIDPKNVELLTDFLHRLSNYILSGKSREKSR